LLSDDDDNDKNGDNEENSKDCLLDEETTSLGSFKPNSSSNQLLKRGQELLKKLTVHSPKLTTNTTTIQSVQMKRDLDGAILSHKQINKSSITIQKIGDSKNETAGKVPGGETTTTTKMTMNVNKYSFLGRDQSYMSRLNSYVSKNLTNVDKALMKNAGAAAGGARRGVTNMMVFSSIEQCSEKVNDENNSSSAKSTRVCLGRFFKRRKWLR
jgi:hypothetical protein